MNTEPGYQQHTFHKNHSIHLEKKNYLFYLNEKVFFNFCDSLLQKDIKTASKIKITYFLIIYFSSMKYFLSYSVVKKRKCLTNIPDVHFRLDV